DSFKIGDEEIQHTKLRFGDLTLPDTDMLIGADFFLSHRVFVATSQRKLYFTYNGGPVFNLATGPSGRPGRPAPEPPAAAGAATTTAIATGAAPAPAEISAAAAEAGAGTAASADAGAPIGDSASAVPAAAAPPIPKDQPTDAAGFSRRGAAYA